MMKPNLLTPKSLPRKDDQTYLLTKVLDIYNRKQKCLDQLSTTPK